MPEHFAPTLDEMMQNRHIVEGSLRNMQVYAWWSHNEDRCRQATRGAFPELLVCLQMGLSVISWPFVPGAVQEFPDDVSTLEQAQQYYSFQYRLFMLARSAQNVKLALDASMDGYYGQALGLCRAILESWKRTAYARRMPSESFRFIPEELIEGTAKEYEGYYRHPNLPGKKDWDRVFPPSAEEHSLDQIDRSLLEMASSHIDWLHEHVHASFGTATLMMERDGSQLDPFRASLAPQFNDEDCSRALRLLGVGVYILSTEISLLLDMSASWKELQKAFGERFPKVFSDGDIVDPA